MKLFGLKHHVVPNSKLTSKDLNFNPSLLVWEGKLVMIYRYMDRIFPINKSAPQFHISPSRLAVAILNPTTFEVESNKPFTLPKEFECYAEDPRLFEHNGSVYLMFNGSNSIKIAKLDSSLDVIWVKKMPKYRGCEKNWSPYSYNGKLYIIYSWSPFEVWLLDNELNIKSRKQYSNNLGWKWGEVRGGTPPLLLRNSYFISFFHSFYLYPYRDIHDERVYVSGYIQFDPDSLKIVSLSNDPVLEPDWNTNHNGATLSPVIFPCGLVGYGPSLIISSGLNDENCVISTITYRELLLVDSKPIENNTYIGEIA